MQTLPIITSKVWIKFPETNQRRRNGGNFMTENALIVDRFRVYFTYPFKIILKTFSYISGYETESWNNRNLLRRLYNSGYLDDGKYQDLCEKNSNNNFDPEELPM